jgi:hypothetical protein
VQEHEYHGTHVRHSLSAAAVFLPYEHPLSPCPRARRVSLLGRGHLGFFPSALCLLCRVLELYMARGDAVRVDGFACAQGGAEDRGRRAVAGRRVRARPEMLPTLPSAGSLQD